MIMNKKAPPDSHPLLAADPSEVFSDPSSSHTGSLVQPSPGAEEVPKYTERAFENVYIPTGGEEPPPEFTPYEAEFFISGKEIVSHDSHLNEDGEALYRFLLSQSITRPEYRIHACGTHTEHKTRTVFSKDQNGNVSSRQEHYTETVTDFDFYVDLTPQIVHGLVHWSLPDAEPAYRGGMVKQVESHNFVDADPESGQFAGRRKATKQELKSAKERKRLREEYGLPPWVAPQPEVWFQQSIDVAPHRAVVLESSKTLRQWADEYCASDKLLKEFTYTKIVYGWNTTNIQEAITAAIRSIYSHDLQLTFELTHDKIRIRPDNRLSRTLSNKWLKFLLWILFIYPFIWLFKRFSRHGGGRWEVCGGAYALKTWRIQPPGVTPPFVNDGRWQETPEGLMHLVGEREGEWFQRWEGVIRRAVRDRIQSKTPLQIVNVSAMVLDGYRPAYSQPMDY